MNQGVEWAVHVLLSLAWVDDRPVSTAALAASYDLPQAYLHKQVQALVRAGLVESLPVRAEDFCWPAPRTRSR